jgi:hypothetical protein
MANCISANQYSSQQELPNIASQHHGVEFGRLFFANKNLLYRIKMNFLKELNKQETKKNFINEINNILQKINNNVLNFLKFDEQTFIFNENEFDLSIDKDNDKLLISNINIFPPFNDNRKPNDHKIYQKALEIFMLIDIILENVNQKDQEDQKDLYTQNQKLIESICKLKSELDILITITKININNRKPNDILRKYYERLPICEKISEKEIKELIIQNDELLNEINLITLKQYISVNIILTLEPEYKKFLNLIDNLLIGYFEKFSLRATYSDELIEIKKQGNLALGHRGRFGLYKRLETQKNVSSNNIPDIIKSIINNILNGIQLQNLL